MVQFVAPKYLSVYLFVYKYDIFLQTHANGGVSRPRKIHLSIAVSQSVVKFYLGLGRCGGPPRAGAVCQSRSSVLQQERTARGMTQKRLGAQAELWNKGVVRIS